MSVRSVTLELEAKLAGKGSGWFSKPSGKLGIPDNATAVVTANGGELYVD